jgi:hypothetical protein
MVRLLIEDITLIKADGIRADIRLRGGATRTLLLSRPRRAWELRQTDRAVVEVIDRWLDDQTDGQIASRLDAAGYRSGGGRRFTARIVARIRRDYGLVSRYDRLRARGLLTLSELAGRLGICTKTVQTWQRAGLVRCHVYNDKNECLYELPDDNRPVKHQGRRLSEQGRFPEVFPDGTHEVQDESEAFSSGLPTAAMLIATPRPASRSVYAVAAYCTPWSEWWTSGRWPRRIARFRAARVSPWSRLRPSSQPRTRRVNTSMTTAR